MKIRFTPEALRQTRAKREWWAAHRPKAPTLLVEELAAAIARLRTGADAARSLHTVMRGCPIYRLLLPRTRLHLYYRHTATGDVEVLTIWNATGGALPDLDADD